MHGRSYNAKTQIVLVAILAFLCFLTFLPFIWVVVTSIKPNSEIYALQKQLLPRAPTLTHFIKVIEKGDQLPRFVVNTLVYSGITIAAVPATTPSGLPVCIRTNFSRNCPPASGTICICCTLT